MSRPDQTTLLMETRLGAPMPVAGGLVRSGRVTERPKPATSLLPIGDCTAKLRLFFRPVRRCRPFLDDADRQCPLFVAAVL